MATWGYQSWYREQTQLAQTYHVTSSIAMRAPFLTAQAKDLLLNGGLGLIKNMIGPFYALELNLGGAFKMTHVEMQTWEDTEDSLELGFTATASQEVGGVSLAEGSLSVGGSVKTFSGNKEYETRVEYQSWGGNSSKWLATNSNGSNFQRVKVQWRATLADENLAIVGIKLFPIWTLVETFNETRAAELKDYFKAVWRRASLRMKDGLFGPSKRICRVNFYKDKCRAKKARVSCPSGCHIDHFQGCGWMKGWRPYCKCDGECFRNATSGDCCPDSTVWGPRRGR